MLPSREMSVFTALATKRAARTLPLAAFWIRRLRYRLLTASLVLVGLGPALMAHGQSAVSMGAERSLYATGSSVNAPYGVAVDAQGDVWTTVSSGTGGVLEIKAVNGVIPASPTTVTVASSSVNGYAKGLAFDSAGDLWVADESAGAVKEIVAVGGVIPASPTVNVIASGVNSPFSLAFDSAGNLWVATQQSGVYIQEFVAVAGVVPVNPTMRVVGSGFFEPTGVAVDASGNVYVADSQNHEVKEMVGVAPPAASTPPASPTINVLASGFGFLNGVAVDASGDVWAADAYQGLYEILAVGGSIPASPAILHLPSLGCALCEDDEGMYNVTIDAHGNVYYTQGDPSGLVNEITPAGNFGQVPVGTTSGSGTMLFGFLASTKIDAPAVYTQGITGLDFAAASGGTCNTTTTYTAGQSCTVNVTFKPLAPGARMGVVELTSGGNLLATAHLYGTGVGPEIVFSPGLQSTLPGPTYASSFNYQFNIAVDAGENVYVPDTGNSVVAKIPWNGANYGTPIQLPFTGLERPEAVAVDGAGNVFVADTNNSRIVELPWNGTSYGTQIVLDSSGLEQPEGIAVDAIGNLFFDDRNARILVEMAWTGSGYGTPTTITAAADLQNPTGLAVDANLNVYIADSGDSQVDEIPWNGVSFGTEIVVPTSGVDNPQGVAVDGGGDVYVVTEDSNQVFEVPWNGTAFGALTEVPSNISNEAELTGIAIDSYGNLFVSDGGDGVLLELNDSTPPSFNFDSTDVGSVSDDSPNTVTISNIGNASLIFTSGTNPNYPTDFPVDTSDSSLCTSATPLTEGGSCDVNMDFLPTTTGPLNEDVVITDNDLNVAGAMQSIPVSGIGLAVSGPPTASLSLSTLNFGGVQIDTTSPALIETVTNTGGGSLNISGLSISQTGDVNYYLGTGANQCTNTTQLTVGQSCNVYVTFKPELDNQTLTGTLNIADNASGSPQTAALTGVGDYFYESVESSLPKAPVSVFFTTSGTLSAINVATMGAQTQDYTVASGGTCATGTAYTAGQDCTVDVIFTPQYSGARNGAIYLTNSSGVVLGATFLQGTGDGAQAIFGPVAPQTQIGYITGLAGVAVDGADNLFYVNGSYRLIEQPFSGSAVTLANLSSLISGGTTSSVAIDPSGNLFIASNSEAPLIEVPSTGTGTWGAPVSVNAGVGNVSDVAVDALGNLYIVAPNSAVYQLPFTGGGYGTPVTLPFAASSTFKPQGVAVDPNLDVYAIGQNSTNQTEVIELPVHGTGYGTAVTTVIAQLTYGSSVATDGNGDLYVSGQTSGTNGAVYFVPTSGSPVLVGTGFYFNFALDSASNIFAVEANFTDQAAVIEIPQATPPSLTFATTAVGSTSTDSPKTVTVLNVGNESLDFNKVMYPADYSENSGDSKLCNDEFPVNAGAYCDVSVDFKPTTTGPLNEEWNSHRQQPQRRRDPADHPAHRNRSRRRRDAGHHLDAGDTDHVWNRDGLRRFRRDGQLWRKHQRRRNLRLYLGNRQRTGNLCEHGSARRHESSLRAVDSFVGLRVAVRIGEHLHQHRGECGFHSHHLESLVDHDPRLLRAHGGAIRCFGIGRRQQRQRRWYVCLLPLDCWRHTGHSRHLRLLSAPLQSACSGCRHPPTRRITRTFSACQNFTVVNAQPTATKLTANNNPVFSLSSVTFTATVTPTTGSIVPTGTVTFLNGSTPIGTGTLTPSTTAPAAVATLTLSSLAIGTDSITASYAGDSNNLASASSPLAEVVEDFAIAANAPSSITIEPGATATYAITLSPLAPATTFPAAITLSLSGLPSGATYAFAPPTIASGSGATETMLTITAPISSLARNESPHAPSPKWPAMALALLLLPIAGKLRRAGRKLSSVLSILLLVAAGLTAMASLSGCGGVPSGYFGQAPATTTISVAGSAGALSHSTSVSLTVE